MKQNKIKQGFMVGIIFGILFIFLILIGFTQVGSDMIGNLLGNLDQLESDANLPIINIFLFTAIIGLLLGLSTSKTNLQNTWLGSLLNSALAGLTAGLLVGGVILLTGYFHTKGIDFRNYLPKVGLQEISYLLHYKKPVSAALSYVVTLTLSSLIGAALGKGLRQQNWTAQSLTWAKDLFENIAEKSKLDQPPQKIIFTVFGLIIAAGLLYFLPLKWGSYWNYTMGTVAIYILLGIGLNIIVGYSGQLVLGYVAFFATGAYTFALLTAPEPHAIILNVWLTVGISVLVSTLTGVLLGLPILNLRGDYLAIVTLGFGEIIRILIRSDLLTFFTNGPKGVINVGQPTWFGSVFSDVNYMHFLMLLVLIALFIAKRLKDSRTGRAWIAIREDQTVAQATGINTFKSKLLALALGASLAGLAGALFASRNQFTGPEDFTLMVSVNVLCIVIVGGMGSLPGVVVGALVLKGLPELLRELEDYRLLVFGALLIAMMIIRPQGLWPTKRRSLELKQQNNSFENNAQEVEP